MPKYKVFLEKTVTAIVTIEVEDEDAVYRMEEFNEFKPVNIDEGEWNVVDILEAIKC